MEEAAISSVIQKLQNYQTNEEIKRIIKETKEILKIMRKKKRLVDARRLNFLASDLVHAASDALRLFEHSQSYYIDPEMEPIHRWIGEIKIRVAEITESSDNDDDDDEDDVQHLIGLEKDMEVMLQMVFRKKIVVGREFVTPVLIKGMPGVGKTTLARQIYRHASVVERFQRRAWVRVSDVLTVKEILIKLIKQTVVLVDGESLEEMDNQSLLDMLSQHLRGMSYLIVLDDVPRQIYLRSLWDALPIEYNGSKLLLTSHMTYQISIFTKADVHRMEPLDPEKSWKLFLKVINSGNGSTSEHEFPKHLEREGKRMLSKCGGLPLAIKEVGKQLAEKKASGLKEWEQLLESVDFSSTLKLLEPFYKKLDPKVKSFFLYMAFYKENTTLRVKKLIQIWVAGGLLSTSYKSYTYIECLTDESVIEMTDKMTEYRMNPVLHRLSVKKAGEELGFEILSSSGNSRLLQNPCHRVIVCSRDKFNYSTNQDKHLVSLFFHGGGYLETSPSYWKRFEQLKILDLEDFGLKFLPESIGTLVELRYLGLRNNYIQEIPYWLAYSLRKLEVLDIAQNSMVEVCNNIWEMDSLVHLYMSDVICRKPAQINVLWNMKTLTYIPVSDTDTGIYDLLGSTLCLSKLGIEGLGENTDVGMLFASLAKLTFLSHLILRGCRLTSMPCLDGLGILRLSTLKLDGRLARLPDSFPRWMSSLTLVDSCLVEDPMPVLEKLRALNHLSLENAYAGREMVIARGGFASLDALRMEELRCLRNVRVAKGGMPGLKKLEIKKCPYLETLPEEIGSIDYLKEVKMVTTKAIATKIRDSNLLSKIEIVSIYP